MISFGLIAECPKNGFIKVNNDEIIAVSLRKNNFTKHTIHRCKIENKKLTI